VGFTYTLKVEEDLSKLATPEPSSADIVAAWHQQGGVGDAPAEMATHVRAALMRAWFERHRKECLGEFDAAVRWAGDNQGWRGLAPCIQVTPGMAIPGPPQRR